MISFDFLITSLIIVLIPGAGVIFTISIALFKSKTESIYAAFGCTLGIIPHLIVSIVSLLSIYSFDSTFFELLRYLGIVYLLYLSYSLFTDKGILKIENKKMPTSVYEIILKAVLINLLNPKLSIFFLSFLPQFLKVDKGFLLSDILSLSLIFMLMTFVVFSIYAILANSMKELLFSSKKNLKTIQKIFAIIFAIFALKLVF